jgi:hypothetical protein
MGLTAAIRMPVALKTGDFQENIMYSFSLSRERKPKASELPAD